MKNLKPVVAGAITILILTAGVWLIYQRYSTVTYYVDPINQCGGPDTKHEITTAVNVEAYQYKIEKVKRKDAQKYEENALRNGKCVSKNRPY